jgi:hypothetical protein
MIYAVGSPHVARASVFVTHLHSEPFLRVIDSLEAWEQKQKRPGAAPTAALAAPASASPGNPSTAATAPAGYYYYFDVMVENAHDPVRGAGLRLRGVRRRCW